jgi:hypothetical protein
VRNARYCMLPMSMHPIPDEETFKRATENAMRALDLSALSREVSRTTRLRIALEAIEQRSRKSRPGNPKEVLQEILDAVMEGTDAPLGNMQLYDRAHNSLKIEVQRGFKAPFLEFFDSVQDDETACGTAFKRSGVVVIEDVKTSPVYSAAARKAMLDAGALACLSVALVTGSKRKVGVISVHYRESGISPVRREALTLLAPKIAAVVANCVGTDY